MSEGKIFIDTNVIIGGYDVTAGNRHKVACNLLTDLWNSGTGVVGTQVLQEFFVNLV
jgi:predicted nucleic acid-binding protein